METGVQDAESGLANLPTELWEKAMTNCTIGMDLGGTRLLLCCGELEESFSTGALFTPTQLLQLLESFIERHGLQPECIGLAVPGLVSNGKVIDCDVLPAFKGWPAQKALQAHAQQVAVLNDVEAALLEEMHDAPANITGGVIMVGTAVGAAFMTQGQPLCGANGWAGELGYLPIQYGNHVRRLDELAGGAAIAKTCAVAPDVLARQAEAGDQATLQVIEQAGTAFGLGLAAVINLFNPAVLAVGGGTSDLPGYWPAALAAARQHSLPALWQSCSLSRVRSGNRVVALGVMRAARAVEI